MSGQWICAITPPHRCELPSLDDAPSPNGAIWQCECGQHWIGERYPNGVEWKRAHAREAEFWQYVAKQDNPDAG